MSKLPAQLPNPWGSEQWPRWEWEFQASLQRMGMSRIEGFLLHRAADLRRGDGELLLDWLLSLQERQLVRRIGVSIYTRADLDGLPLDRLQLVQLPLSLYDQRLLLDGTIESLHSAGLGVHARSVFLQGLLLQDPCEWPPFLTEDFGRHHARLSKECAAKDLTLLEAALGFVHRCSDLEAVVVGVTTAKELEAIQAAWERERFPTADGLTGNQAWAWENPSDLDPRNWPLQ